MKNTKAQILTHISFLITIEILLSRFLSISTPIVKIGFAFLPIAIVAFMYGPWYAGISYAIGDFIGASLFPIGPYFPGFTITAFLVGATYGIGLHNNYRSLLRIICTVLVAVCLVELGLNTLWLHMLTGKTYLVLLPPRIIKCFIIVPIEVLTIRMAGTVFDKNGFCKYAQYNIR